MPGKNSPNSNPSFQQLAPAETGSFLSYWVRSPRFGFHWHYHPEIEICYVVKGRGTRLVGDHSTEFEAGDLVLVGSNTPHTWISDPNFNEQGNNMEVVVIQFPVEWQESVFETLAETRSIRNLIQQAKRGLFFPTETEQVIGPKLKALVSKKGFLRFHALLEVLHLMSESKTSKALASERYTPTLGQESETRIAIVCGHIHEQFKNPIRLKEMAALAQMSPTAFCRFFKKMTGKTLLDYVTDLRISNACSLLLEGRQTISEVAYESGFNSITHFNRSFRARKNQTPKAYRLEIQGLKQGN